MELEMSLEPRVQLAPAKELALGLKLMVDLTPVLEGPTQVMLAPALPQVVGLELDLSLAQELALALALEVAGALDLAPLCLNGLEMLQLNGEKIGMALQV